MGEKDSALKLLKEIDVEGSENQQARIKDLLKKAE